MLGNCSGKSKHKWQHRSQYQFKTKAECGITYVPFAEQFLASGRELANFECWDLGN